MEANNEPAKTVSKKILTKVAALVVGVFLLILIVLFTRGIMVRSIIGGTRETKIPIPKFLEGAQIIFNNQMYYQIGIPEEDTKTPITIAREIVEDESSSRYYPNRFTYEPVSMSTKFSVIGAINVAQYGLSAIDSGTKGLDSLILQDEKGNKSLVPYFYLYTSVTNGLQDALNASYYKNGEMVGYIRETDFNDKQEQFIPPDGFTELHFSIMNMESPEFQNKTSEIVTSDVPINKQITVHTPNDPEGDRVSIKDLLTGASCDTFGYLVKKLFISKDEKTLLIYHNIGPYNILTSDDTTTCKIIDTKNLPN